MENRHFARDLFHEYKLRTRTETDIYSRLLTTFPTGSFPKYANKVLQSIALAMLWGEIATKLNGGKVDYIKEWRAGR